MVYLKYCSSLGNLLTSFSTIWRMEHNTYFKHFGSKQCSLLRVLDSFFSLLENSNKQRHQSRCTFHFLTLASKVKGAIDPENQPCCGWTCHLKFLQITSNFTTESSWADISYYELLCGIQLSKVLSPCPFIFPFPNSVSAIFQWIQVLL